VSWKKPRILLLIGQHLSNAPRPQKEALALMDAGFDVTISGSWNDELQAKRDLELVERHNYRLRNYLDIRPSRKLRRFAGRVRNRVARIGWRRLKRFSPELLGYGARAMYRFARDFSADLTIGHSEASLWACRRLHESGRRIGVDFEDWFSRDLLPEARAARPISKLAELEKFAAEHSTYHLTTSDVLAKAMSEANETRRAATVYNVFPRAEGTDIDGQRLDRITDDRPSLHWYSQTVGPGRGLEEVCDAVAQIDEPLELHFRGRCDPDYEGSLRQRLRDDQRAFFKIHDTVSNAELPSRIADHDIGLALEQLYCDSRNLTITNKFFQYLQGGLAVVASRTDGQVEGVSKAKCGVLVEPGNVDDLKRGLLPLLKDRQHLEEQKVAARHAAKECFSWEHMQPIVVEQAEKALAGA
tara:strand:+ start:5006 stop:6247 length:1242 start_codon:yes stop_codon:yes gene_type:complete